MAFYFRLAPQNVTRTDSSPCRCPSACKFYVTFTFSSGSQTDCSTFPGYSASVCYFNLYRYGIQGRVFFVATCLEILRALTWFYLIAFFSPRVVYSVDSLRREVKKCNLLINWQKLRNALLVPLLIFKPLTPALLIFFL